MSTNKEEKCRFKSKIGGQALIEGIMMRGIDKSAMACRLADGTIDVEEWEINNGKNAPWYKKTPFVRGIFNFIETLVEGYKCLSKSADKQMEDPDEEKSKFELWLENKLGDKLMPVLSVVATVLGILLAIGLFVFIPTFVVKFFDDIIQSNFLLTLIEGIIKIIIFIIYLWLTSMIKDIQTTYMYHGAEHKTISCYEAGEELTVENIKKHSRFHPRCGTSFIIIVLIVSILVFSVVTWSSRLARVAIKLLLLPVVVGISYEIIKLAGRYTNIATRIISAPGLALQRLTTREPDEKQIEVAIAAMERVIPDDKEDDKW